MSDVSTRREDEAMTWAVDPKRLGSELRPEGQEGLRQACPCGLTRGHRMGSLQTQPMLRNENSALRTRSLLCRLF